MKGTRLRRKPSCLARLPLAAAIGLAISGNAWAQGSEQAPVLDAVTVTSQKRSENLQQVPVSIQVLGAEQLDELHVSDLEDVAIRFPSVSFQRLGEVPSNFQVYMRGVASGGDGNHSGPLPSVGVYVDEQPVTTIRGAIDLHPYDIERVEALAGPQGTLYGASSQSGTLRIITNKPDPSAFAAGYGVEYNSVSDGGSGHVLETYVNLPVNESTAIRLVGWDRDDAGFVDNRFGERTFPSSGITINNGNRAEDDYNYGDTTGARAALSIDLNDSWTIMPSVITQRQDINGSFGVNPDVGELATTQFYPQTSEDRFTQSALTVQGKLGNFDVTYAYAHLNRDLDTQSDYNDYAFWYDTLFGYGTYFYDDNGDLINPAQFIQATNGYSKISHELRIASPAENRFRFVAGVFSQRQGNNIQERYLIDGLADSLSVTGWPDTIWLTRQRRDDRDEALFGELSFDITDQLTATAGARFFRVDNSLRGYFGFSDGYVSNPTFGEGACNTQDLPPFPNAPCEVFNKSVKENDHLGRFNLSYQVNDDLMIYGTWSEGYRPGGVNRRGTLDPYLSDFLTNLEFGWKSSWLDNRLILNGAVFEQDWEDFQFAILGQNGLTEIKNANQARIRGLEADLSWAASYNLRISSGVAFYDAELTENYCGFTDASGNPETDCADPEARAGSRLPISARFKGNLTARYTFDVGRYEAHLQGVVAHEGDRRTDLRSAESAILGNLDSYTMFDLSAGFGVNTWKVDVYIRNLFDERAELSRFTQCAEAVCGEQAYTVFARPRTFGLRFSQEF